jgi:hypothetical protein
MPPREQIAQYNARTERSAALANQDAPVTGNVGK